jgi:hypothetical protein
MAKSFRSPTDNCAKMGKFPGSFPEKPRPKSPGGASLEQVL